LYGDEQILQQFRSGHDFPHGGQTLKNAGACAFGLSCLENERFLEP
jgi:hypothetical protein